MPFCSAADAEGVHGNVPICQLLVECAKCNRKKKGFTSLHTIWFIQAYRLYFISEM